MTESTQATYKGVTITVHDTYEEVQAFTREAYITGPDGQDYRVDLAFVEWDGYAAPTWFDATGTEIDEPEWAINLSGWDLDIMTGNIDLDLSTRKEV